jgi:hypothetical protein
MNKWFTVLPVKRILCRRYGDEHLFHIYFLPLFPLSKEVNIICKKCGLGRYGSAFNSGILKNYAALKGKFKHPWYTYIFPAFAAFLIIMVIFFN